MAQQDAPLSSLCSICYTDPPKYVCPRDHVRTCSLPCYKRHQQRASCSGKRDPTAYMKKETLTTPAGIDHDYNFLSGVDRVFDKADRELEERGIGQTDHSHRKRWQWDGPLQKYLRANQILVDRAPVGMSRQKANQTRYVQKSKRIVWTVEWVQPDGSKRMSEVHEAASIGDAYRIMLEDKERESKKRKLDHCAGPSGKVARVVDHVVGEPAIEGTTSHDLKPADDQQNQGHSSTSTQPVPFEAVADSSQPDPSAPATSIPLPSPQVDLSSTTSSQPLEQHSTTAPDSDDTRTLILSRIQSEQSRQASIRASKLPTSPPYFYLLRPHTSATSRVLIPLSADNTLTASLELRTVLEFPTIYILDQGQDSLPPTFQTEEAYLKTRQEEDKEVEELLRAVPNGAAEGRVGAFGERAAAVQGADSGELDPSKILEMLRRDVPN